MDDETLKRLINGHKGAVGRQKLELDAFEELHRLRRMLPSCPGIEVEPGKYSGCAGGEDCPTCLGKWRKW